MSYLNKQTSIREFLCDMVPHCYLPAIQRELVWDMGQIEDLFDSITRGYPIGALLLWQVRKPVIHDYCFYELVREYDAERPHNRKANLDDLSECIGILDGQQRTTALYLGFKGSFRQKKPRKWRSRTDAWVTRALHLNLLHAPSPEKEERRFDFRFLSVEEAKERDERHYWFRVGEILQFEDNQALRTWRRATDYRDNSVFEDNLNALWGALEHQTGISYFSESSQDPNDVLTLFVRLNMGGEPLSYSDMLLSLATATWRGHDARQEVYALVDTVNKECGAEFKFTKDFALKTLLVLNDGDVRFRTENIRRKAELEHRWDAVKRVLPLTVRLVASFGLTGETLTANNAIIPIAYYLDRTQRKASFVTHKQFEGERDAIRRWLTLVLVGQVFGGQSDAILTNVRAVLKENETSGIFPADAILAKLKKSEDIAISGESAESLVDNTQYGKANAFLLLSLITPVQLDPSVQYHVDHIHPKAHFTKAKFNECRVPEEEAKWFLEHRDTLPNLQILTQQVNQSKLQTSYETWLSQQHNPQFYRELGLMPPKASLGFAGFRAFYEERRRLIIKKLKEVLGPQPAAA